MIAQSTKCVISFCQHLNKWIFCQEIAIAFGPLYLHIVDRSKKLLT